MKLPVFDLKGTKVQRWLLIPCWEVRCSIYEAPASPHLTTTQVPRIVALASLAMRKLSAQHLSVSLCLERKLPTEPVS